MANGGLQWSWPGHRRRAVLAGFLLVASSTVALTTGPATAATLTHATTPLAGDRLDGVGLAVLQVGTTVYVGGTFTTVRDQAGASVATRTNLAAFDATTGRLRTTFRADANGTVRALATDGTRLFVGGSFTTVNGTTRNRLAAVDLVTGAVVTAFRAEVTSHVYALATYPGNLVVGGSFSTIGGQARSRLAIVATDTGAVRPFAPTFDNTVVTVDATTTGDRIVVGGNFATVNGVARTRAVVLTPAGALAPTQLQNVGGPLSAITIAGDDRTLVTSMTGAANSTNRYDLLTGARLWAHSCDGDGQAVDEYAGTTYGGYHESCGGDTTIRLEAYDTATGTRDASLRPAFDLFWGVRAIDAGPAGLAIAGEFTSVAGVAVQGVAIFPATAAPPPEPTTTTTSTTTTTTTTTTTLPPTVDVGFPIALGSTWRYRDEATAPDSAWVDPAYDDTAWKLGTAQLGYGDGDERTVIGYGPSANAKYLTAWFRRGFTLGTLPPSLVVRLVADDGALVRVNGVEVVRDNLPTGTITPTTLAATNRSANQETAVRSFTVPVTALRIGTNVITVEVHQDAPSSSDLSFDLSLAAS